MTSTNKALMVSEALKTASLYRNTYVFGGYIRDVLIHGNSVEELHDLDLFFQCGRDINSFENIFSIFHELVEKDYEGDKERYGDTRKVIKFTYKNTHGGGNLIAGSKQVFINNLLVVNHTPDQANPDSICPIPPHCNPETAGGSPDVNVGD